MSEGTTNGIISIESRHSVDDTLDKLKGILTSQGVKIFALVDHSGEAEHAGLQMRNTKLLIFGNPKAGTPLMLASPTAALDLPAENPDLGRRRQAKSGSPTTAWNSSCSGTICRPI